jgi:hypothetical protein
MKNLCFKTFILENHLIPITNPFLSNANRINGYHIIQIHSTLYPRRETKKSTNMAYGLHYILHWVIPTRMQPTFKFPSSILYKGLTPLPPKLIFNLGFIIQHTFTSMYPNINHFTLTHL